MKRYYEEIIRRSDAIVKELSCKTVSQALEKLKKEEVILNKLRGGIKK